MDRDEFTRRVQDAEPMLLNMARNILRNPHDGADAVQDAVLKAWVALPNLRDKLKFEGWLVRIMQRECYAKLRKIRRETPMACVPEPASAVAASPDLDEAINTLSAEDARIIRMHHEQGYPIHDIAALLELPENLIKVRLFRARRKLRLALIAMLILLAFAGVSLALARNTGVLDFLFPGRPAPTPLSVQTGLPQVGGSEMERLIVEVRDAVSDGITVHISVAFSVRDPEKEAVLKAADEAFIYEINGYRRTPIDETMEGVGFRRPFVSKLSDKESIYIVDCLYTIDGPFQVADTNWLYESPGILVIDYIIDLRGAFYVDGSSVRSQLPHTSPLLVRFLPIVAMINDEGEYETVERGDINVTVTHTTLETSAYAATNLPIEFGSFTLTAARYTVTPIGVYADYEFFDPLEEPGTTRFFTTERRLAIGMFDENGVGISFQTSGEPRIQYGSGGRYVSRAIYPVLKIPETVKIRPYESVCENGQWHERIHQPVTLYLKLVE